MLFLLIELMLSSNPLSIWRSGNLATQPDRIGRTGRNFRLGKTMPTDFRDQSRLLDQSIDQDLSMTSFLEFFHGNFDSEFR